MSPVTFEWWTILADLETVAELLLLLDAHGQSSAPPDPAAPHPDG